MNTIHRIALLVLSTLPLGCASTSSVTFATPEEAIRRLVEGAEDRQVADTLLGPGGFDLLRSGDEVADKQDYQAVVEMIREKLAFEDVGEDRKIARIGNDAWEFPIPLVRDGKSWRFDVESGREEVMNRRVGRNELSTLETLRAMVAAQREYAAEGRDGNPPTFARRLLSSPGKHDGLYWPAAEGQDESPLGPFVAEAAEEGYRSVSERPIPYHGYFYRLLTAQGPGAPGGARSYLDAQTRLTRGFAVLAWPATYGNSGVMTFLVNQQGIVFQRDLGDGTAKAAAAIEAYDPDASWTPTSD
ncbi:MAG: DUF2950 domain-containing protein [Planctomycetota bacterium]|nr:DUF2950 domain-containing protein [Planctomycetota bacterium]